MIGFVLDYCRSDMAFALLQWAKWLDAAGCSIRLFPVKLERPVSSYWDDKAERFKTKTAAAFMEGCRMLVFDFPPPTIWLRAARQAKVRIVVVCDWARLSPAQMVALEEADTVVCPSASAHRYLRSLQPPLRRLLKLPWDACLPSLRGDQEVDPRRVAAVLNLDGDVGDNDLVFVDRLAELLASPFFYLTVFYNAKLPNAARVSLDTLRFKADGRLETLACQSLERQVLTMAAHDLVLYPRLADNFGLTGLLAQAAGVPCLAYDHPVVAELVKDGRGGELVPCDLEFTELGAPRVVPATRAFLDAALGLIADPDRLQLYREQVQHERVGRSEYFQATSLALFKSCLTR